MLQLEGIVDEKCKAPELPGPVGGILSLFHVDQESERGMSRAEVFANHFKALNKSECLRTRKNEISPSWLVGRLCNAGRLAVRAAPGGCHTTNINPVKLLQEVHDGGHVFRVSIEVAAKESGTWGSERKVVDDSPHKR